MDLESEERHLLGFEVKEQYKAAREAIVSGCRIEPMKSSEERVCNQHLSSGHKQGSSESAYKKALYKAARFFD